MTEICRRTGISESVWLTQQVSLTLILSHSHGCSNVCAIWENDANICSVRPNNRACTCPKESNVKLASKILLVLLVVWIAGHALYRAVDPSAQSGVLKRLVTTIPWAGYCHIVAGSFALILGAFQMSSRLRRQKPSVHRMIGNAYVACVMISTVGAITGLPYSQAPLSAICGFWLLAIVWPIVTLAGYPRGEKYDFHRHGTLMSYSYALTCAAITLRLYLIPMLVCGVPFKTAYPIAAWAGGLGNVVIVWLALKLIRSRPKDSENSDTKRDHAVGLS